MSSLARPRPGFTLRVHGSLALEITPKKLLTFSAEGARPPLKSAAIAASASQIGTLKTSRLLSQPPQARLERSRQVGCCRSLQGPGCWQAMSWVGRSRSLYSFDCQAAATTAFKWHWGLGGGAPRIAGGLGAQPPGCRAPEGRSPGGCGGCRGATAPCLKS